MSTTEVNPDRSWGGHFRRTLLAGAFAAAPVVVTVYGAVWVELQTRQVTDWLFGRSVPLLGLVLIVVAVYLIGLFVQHAIGKFVVRAFDRVLRRVPLLREAYRAWKQVSFAPGGGEGMYTHVALVPSDVPGHRAVGFSDGVTDRGSGLVCVFVPATPNPIAGRLVFVPAAEVVYLDVSVEDAFKMLISTGNFVPPLLARGSPRAASAEQADEDQQRGPREEPAA